VVLMMAASWPFFAGRNAVDIATLAMIYVMLGLGLNVVVGFAGLLDLGFVGFYAVGAYTYALLFHWAGWTFWEALPLAGAPRPCSASCWAFRCCACAATIWPS
jgi:branched-chain amino acid transport system permease protein